MDEWRFRFKRSDEVSSDSLASGYFSNDELTSDAIALVRESIQNSIDARVSDDLPARVVFSFHRKSDPTGLAELFGSLEQHTQQVLGTDRGRLKESARHLVIEDFNTKGLRGDSSSSETSREDDSYVWFLWKEGSSSKAHGTKGKKGVGKAVFPKVSGLRSFFVYSVRPAEYSPCGKQNIFIGKAKLKYHTLGHGGKTFAPDGWFADWISQDEGDVPTPFTSDRAVELARYWNVRRDVTETGLSIVIPQLEDEITPDAVRSSVIRQFFLAIKLGEVECEIISEDGTSEILTSESFNEAFRSTPPQKKIVPRDLDWSHVGKAVDLVDSHLAGMEARKLKVDDHKSPVTRYPLSRYFLGPLSSAIGSESSAAVDVEVDVPVENSRKTVSARFRILIGKSPGASFPIIYAREGLLVPGTQSISASGHVVVVIIPPGPLGDFLGDSEGPSHESWSASEEVFREKYAQTRAQSERLISIVRQLPKRIDEELNRVTSEKGDANYFSKYFKLRLPDAEPKEEEKKEAEGDAGPIDAVSKVPRLSISRSTDTVLVTRGDKSWDAGTKFHLEFAFATAVGNPFKQWSPFDFDLREPSFRLNLSGLNLISRSQRELSFEISSSENWKLEVVGFDPYRDVEVRDKSFEIEEEARDGD